MYKPLPSVWYEDDAPLIEEMLEFYPRQTPEVIIDTTYNKGRFWKGTKRKVISVDINPQFNPDYVCDNKQMPFEDNFADVIVYDPPHLTDQDTVGSSKIWVERFGNRQYGDNMCHEYPLFAKEAYRVLKPEGILLAKIADTVHNHRSQWEHIHFVTAAKEANFTPCDCIVKVRNISIKSSKWKKAHHARKYHCFWIVCRKSHKCE